MATEQRTFPHPYKRQTHGAFREAEEALQAGRNLIHLLNGVPCGYRMAVFQRLGAYLLVSYPISWPSEREKNHG